MKIISIFVVWVFAALSLKAQGVWIEENIDPTGRRTGVIRVNGNDYRIAPSADLSTADLEGADLSRANLMGAILHRANLIDADLSAADLSATDLSRAFLGSANLRFANLFEADLTRTSLSRANLTGVYFYGATSSSADITPMMSVIASHAEEIQTLEGSHTTNTTAIATNTRNITDNKDEIEAIKVQLATLVDALAAKDAEIEQQALRIAEVEAERDARPSQGQLTAVEEERDALLADIQLAFDVVNAAAGEPESDLVEIIDPENTPAEVQIVGVIAQPLEAFEVNTFDSPNNLDTELGLYDTNGNLVETNDDAGAALQSRLNFSDGLAGGIYYLAVGTYNSTFNNSDFEVSSTGRGGEYTLTLPTGPISGTLEASGFDWYRIEIGTAFTAVQLQPLTEIFSNLAEVNTSVILERDAAISERDARPTQEQLAAVEAERDARSTLAELQDARAGSVILAPDENGNIQLKLEIEESSDLEVWLNEGKKLEGEFQLAEGKKFMRFALVAGN